MRTALTFMLFFVSFSLMPTYSSAHGIAGKRFFPTTFQADDPFISDEFSILGNRITGIDAKTNEMHIDFSKRILPGFGVEFHEAYIHHHTPDGSVASGWDNLGVGVKWQFFTNDTHETILSIGTDIDIGGTGSHRNADSFSLVSPTFFFGKGFGDLPESIKFLRPIAVTGTIGPSLPTRSSSIRVNPDTGENDIEWNPKTLSWGLTFQYSLMYLDSFVKNIGIGNPFKRTIIIAEFPMETCMNMDCKGQTTGMINSGIVWAGKKIELGVAAQIPANSRSGNSIGVFGLIHLFIDDLFPKSLGRPIFHQK